MACVWICCFFFFEVLLIVLGGLDLTIMLLMILRHQGVNWLAGSWVLALVQPKQDLDLNSRNVVTLGPLIRCSHLAWWQSTL